jgi:predicted nuclease of restriction endonuclease-like (RecB) superfamily
LVRNLGRFIAELGRDFCFVGSEYLVQLAARTLRLTSSFSIEG